MDPKRASIAAWLDKGTPQSEQPLGNSRPKQSGMNRRADDDDDALENLLANVSLDNALDVLRAVQDVPESRSLHNTLAMPMRNTSHTSLRPPSVVGSVASMGGGFAESTLRPSRSTDSIQLLFPFHDD